MARPIALLLARVALGFIFFAHGWEKFVVSGIDATAAYLRSESVPLPWVAALGTAILELVGGAALVLGLLLPVFGMLFTLDMLGAFIFVHADKGIFVSTDGFELVLGLAAASLAIAFSGGGMLAADSRLRRHRAKASEHAVR
ncbi:DoxX family protein [Sphaerimonospora cavernae]|uniref:DoxX family protein n=1 Tax=Sphaerimonospora cavernae TaxID=1740611 RepID=A0ABV6U887_9ACTN